METKRTMANSFSSAHYAPRVPVLRLSECTVRGRMEPMPRPSKYSPGLRQRAVRMVFEHVQEYPSRWAAMQSIAANLGCTWKRCGGGCAG